LGQALQGSNSRRGSSILEGTGAADRRIEKSLVTVKVIASCKTPDEEELIERSVLLLGDEEGLGCIILGRESGLQVRLYCV
jgi:hypothetical protein